ncbi:MAG: hypothetical protein FWG98_06615 [Candidatus Cloacimonetes bacterium]|nr:hypothetical protein [Candidatus Cloacimonadota bacterium]
MRIARRNLATTVLSIIHYRRKQYATTIFYLRRKQYAPTIFYLRRKQYATTIVQQPLSI